MPSKLPRYCEATFGDKSRLRSNPLPLLGVFPFRSQNQSNVWDNSVMNPELAAQYRGLLSETQQKLHDRAWVNVLQQWLDELATIDSAAQWKRHAERTARALGGMESIGEIALASQDASLLNLVDRLYAACKQIRETALA